MSIRYLGDLKRKMKLNKHVSGFIGCFVDQLNKTLLSNESLYMQSGNQTRNMCMDYCGTNVSLYFSIDIIYSHHGKFSKINNLLPFTVLNRALHWIVR